MTISSETRRAGPFVGTGIVTVFPFAFKVFSSSDVRVVRALTSTGVETELVLNSDYTVSLNADQDTAPGGSVTLSSALASGYTMVITSDIAPLQAMDFTNMGGFYPANHTNALDKLTILVQQLTESVSRSLRTAITTPTGVSTELPAPVAYKIIGWNQTADALENTDPSGSSTLAADLATASATKGAAMVGFIQAGVGAVARLAQDKLRDRVSVNDFGATGDGATNDAAAIQAAFTAASSGGLVYFPPGSYKIGSAISLTKPVKVSGSAATITQTSTGNAFTFSEADQTSAAFYLAFDGLTITGNAKASGSKAIEVSNNNPFVFVNNCQISGWDIGIKLTDSYCSKISGCKIANNNVGIDLFDACHASVLENNLTDYNTTAGVRANYGGGTTSLHNLTFIGGAYQNSPIGVWLENIYEPNIANPYFEGNTNIDMQLGKADAGGYARACYNAKVTTFQTASPINTGATKVNINIEHAVGVDIDAAGFYNNTGNYHVAVDGYSDRINVDYYQTTLASPWNFPATVDAFRVALSQNGRDMLPYDEGNNGKCLSWYNPATLAYLAHIFYGAGVSGRKSLIIESNEANSDVLLRVPAATGIIRFTDDSNNEILNIDPLNNRVQTFKPLVLPAYTVATLPASGAYSRCFVTNANATTFNSIVAGGGANKVPVYHDGTNWRIG